MDSEFLLLGLFLTVFCGLLIRFRRDSKELEQQHQIRILAIEDIILQNQNQIYLRKNGLGRYDFRKFNLQDALMAQHEIDIDT